MKKILFFLCGIVLGISAFAQTSVTIYEPNAYEMDDVVIKEYNYPVAITSVYVSEEGCTMFAYRDATLTSIEVRLDNFHVRDFVIDNDTVFFCGQSKDGYGKIGFFDIQNLFFGGGTFCIFNTSGLPNNKYVADLSKLVTYTCIDENTLWQERHIVSVGYEIDSLYGCLVDLFRDIDQSYFCNTGYIPSSPQNSLRDIAVVGDYLVTAGFEHTQYLTLRAYKQDGAFSLYGIQNYVHIYNDFSQCDIREWKTDDALLATISDDKFATASICYNVKEDSWDKIIHRVHLAEYKLSTLLSHGSNSMLLSSEVYFPNYSTVNNLYGFVSNNTSSAFGVLLKSKKGHSLFFETDHLLGSLYNRMTGYTGEEQCEDKGWQGLDLYNGDFRYVMSGRCSNDNALQTFQVETQGIQSACMPDAEYVIMESCMIPAVVNKKPYVDWGWIAAPQQVIPINITYNELIIECEEEQ